MKKLLLLASFLFIFSGNTLNHWDIYVTNESQNAACEKLPYGIVNPDAEFMHYPQSIIREIPQHGLYLIDCKPWFGNLIYIMHPVFGVIKFVVLVDGNVKSYDYSAETKCWQLETLQESTRKFLKSRLKN